MSCSSSPRASRRRVARRLCGTAVLILGLGVGSMHDSAQAARGGNGGASAGGGGGAGGGRGAGSVGGSGAGRILPGFIGGFGGVLPPREPVIVEEGPIEYDGLVVARRRRPVPVREVIAPSPRLVRVVRQPIRPPSPQLPVQRPLPRLAALVEPPGIVPREILVVLRAGAPADSAGALARRYRLTLLAAQSFTLVPETVERFGIGGRRAVAAVVAALQADPLVQTVQPNHVFTLADAPAPAPAYAAAQYAIPKLHLDQAHHTATGTDVPVAVIDTAVDQAHPALAGAIGESTDLLANPPARVPDTHGTAIVGLIAARAMLDSAAPAAKILAIRAFAADAAGPPSGAEGTTLHVIRALDWAAAHGARVVNMSFAGPQDALLSTFLQAGASKGTIYVAAAGNAGPTSPPLFPAADPAVLAVTATDADNKVFTGANSGSYIGIAAPGVDIFVATPRGGFGYASGTSMAAAEVSGIVALMIQQHPSLDLAGARAALKASAVPLTGVGAAGVGLADADAALQHPSPAAPAINVVAQP